jgi:3-hydroxy-3-methylglutaryl CoA synthase
MGIPVGIDDLNLYCGSLSVDAGELVEARGKPKSYAAQFEFTRRSLAPSFEDPVTLAVNAAKPIVEAAGRDRFELLVVATESGVDYGKPLSTYVHKYLGLGSNVRNFEIKHACFAGTAALRTACDWAAVRGDPKARALVIMTDMARKIFGDPAEAAEGAGAVALSVGLEPRVLSIEDTSASATQEVYDVTRPTPTLERANASLSLGAYLDLLELAWAGYRKRNGTVSLERDFTYALYHAPLVGLVKKAHAVAVECERPEATPEEIAASFDRMVRPSLHFCREIGNIYSGSLYAALASLLEYEPACAGKRISLYSYGSGSCAELYAGTLGREAPTIVSSHGIRRMLRERRPASVGEYEATVLETECGLTQAEFEPDLSLPAEHYEQAYKGKGLLVLERVNDYYRTYRWS